jgi:hypothetical protein
MEVDEEISSINERTREGEPLGLLRSALRKAETSQELMECSGAHAEKPCRPSSIPTHKPIDSRYLGCIDFVKTPHQ